MVNNPPISSEILTIWIIRVLELIFKIHRFSFVYVFFANDGKTKIKAALARSYTQQVELGSLQNLGLIRLINFVVSDVGTAGKRLMVSEMEIVTEVLEKEITAEPKQEEPRIILKPKQEIGIHLKPKKEVVAKSAAEIVHEQNGNMPPSVRTATTRRVSLIVALNPYQGNWTIEVRVTNKGNLRSYNGVKGEGHVFNVELTDQDGTQIQATMFNEAAKKFDRIFEMGKVYYISKGTIRLANKKYKTVENAYEMTLNENSTVELVTDQETIIPKMIYNFVQIGQLSSYINAAKLVDVIGVVQSVSSTMNIRRKSDFVTEIPKRDITIADDSKKTVVVSLWNDLATSVGEELLDAVNNGSSPIIAIKSLKVGDFNGVSLSTLSRSTVMINPDVPESKKLKSWYESEGKGATMEHVGLGLASNSPSYGYRKWKINRFLNPNLRFSVHFPNYVVKLIIDLEVVGVPFYLDFCKTVTQILWECGHWERHLIIKRISEHVLSRHLSLSKENIVPVADQLDFCLLHGNGGNFERVGLGTDKRMHSKCWFSHLSLQYFLVKCCILHH
ncbi:hypothetical protein ACHQM5_001284 [Ranunculus cassubicifolius]